MNVNENDDKKMMQTIREGQVIPERSNEYWSEEERARLASLYCSGAGLSQIALELRRTEMAVVQQLVTLNLMTPPRSNKRRKRRKKGCICYRCEQKNRCSKGGGSTHA